MLKSKEENCLEWESWRFQQLNFSTPVIFRTMPMIKHAIFCVFWFQCNCHNPLRLWIFSIFQIHQFWLVSQNISYQSLTLLILRSVSLPPRFSWDTASATDTVVFHIQNKQISHECNLRKKFDSTRSRFDMDFLWWISISFASQFVLVLENLLGSISESSCVSIYMLLVSLVFVFTQIFPVQISSQISVCFCFIVNFIQCPINFEHFCHASIKVRSV